MGTPIMTNLIKTNNPINR